MIHAEISPDLLLLSKFYQKLQIKLFAIKFNKLTDYEDFDKILLLFWGREDHDSKFFV